MNNSGNQVEDNPTHRLLELIRSKGHPGPESDRPPGPFVHDPEPSPPRLFTPANFPQLGIEIADGQLKIVGSVITKGQPRIFLWQALDFPYNLHSEDFGGKLKNVLSDVLGQTAASYARRLQIWANYEFSREEFHVLTLPVMKKKDLPAALSWSLKRQLDVDIQQSALDFEILGQVEENKVQKYQVLAVLLDKQEVSRLQGVFARTGYPLTGVTPSALATLNLFRSQCISPAVPNVGLLDIGRRSSRIVILSHQNVLLHRKIRTGSHNILEEVSGMQFSSEVPSAPDTSEQKTAEDRLLEALLSTEQAHSSDESQDIISAIEPGMDRLIRQVERTLSYHTRNLGHKPVQRIYLSGRLSAARPIQNQISRTLDLDLKLLDGFSGNISLATPQPASLDQRLNLSSTIGLSLSKADRTLNFLHTFAHKAKDRKMLQARVAGIVCVTMLLCLLGGYHLWQNVLINTQQDLLADSKKQAQRMEARLQNLKVRIGNVQSGPEAQGPDQLLPLMEAKYGYWQKYAARFKPLAYVSEIFSLLPDNVRIENIYAYLQDKGHKVSFQMNTEPKNPSERILYSDPQAGITLQQARPSQTPVHESFDKILLIKGIAPGREHTKHVLLSRLRQRLDASPLFQVWDSRGQELISPSTGAGIQFHLLLKANEP